MGILVKNGEIITATERFIGDVYCVDGKIAAVGLGLSKQKSDDTETHTYLNHLHSE